MVRKIEKPKRIFRSQTIAEVLIVMLVIGVVVASAMTSMTKRKTDKSWDTNSIICIKNEKAQNLASSACFASISACRYDRYNACNTMRFYADYNGNTTIQDAARKVFSNICNQGGEEACKYFISSCQKDNATCDNSTSNYDIQYYLNLPTSDTNTGRYLIEDNTKPYYKLGYTNIKKIVDNTCCQNGTYNTACVINGGNCTTSGCSGGVLLGTLCVKSADESSTMLFPNANSTCINAGWRLPTLSELTGTMNGNSTISGSITPNVFYWGQGYSSFACTASYLNNAGSQRWGGTMCTDGSTSYHVRCVK
jgi:hypothetical protein